MSTLELYQESVPFSNKRLDQKASTDGNFTNPVVVPFSFDFTSALNSLECVIYIKNTSTEFRYENVIVSLMEEPTVAATAAHATISDDGSDNITFSLSGTDVRVGFSVEDNPLTGGQQFSLISDPDTDKNGYYDSYIPVGDSHNKLNVRFSYGYDEISGVDWNTKGNVLIIPNIGTTGIPDTSYHPVRIRIDWRDRTELFTVRDFFLDISYQNKLAIGV